MQSADEIKKQWDSERKVNNLREDKGYKVDRTREKGLLVDWCKASMQEKRKKDRADSLSDAIAAVSKPAQSDKQFFSV